MHLKPNEGFFYFSNLCVLSISVILLSGWEIKLQPYLPCTKTFLGFRPKITSYFCFWTGVWLVLISISTVLLTESQRLLKEYWIKVCIYINIEWWKVTRKLGLCRSSLLNKILFYELRVTILYPIHNGYIRQTLSTF